MARDASSYSMKKRNGRSGGIRTQLSAITLRAKPDRVIEKMSWVRQNIEEKWSEWRDSNPRPLVPQTSALTGLRYTPT